MKPPLVLLHAFPLSSSMWEAERTALAPSFHVITPDLPGFGESPRQKTPSIPGMARGVAEFLDCSGVREPVFIGGLSMGGYVAFEFFRQFPERVRGMGLFSTRAVADTPEGRETRLKTVEKIRKEGLGPFSEVVLPKLLGRSTLKSQPEVVLRVKEMILRSRPEGVIDALLAMSDRRDSTDLLGTIRCPAFVVAGEEDSFIPAAEAEAMSAKIPKAELALIRKAGHLVNLEQPAVFQELLKRFLQGKRFAFSR